MYKSTTGNTGTTEKTTGTTSNTRKNSNKDTVRAIVKATQNKRDILSLLEVAKLVRVEPGNKEDSDPVYTLYDFANDDSTEGLTALFLPDQNGVGLLIDYSDWHHVEFYYALTNNKEVRIIGRICFEIHKSTLVLRDTFLVPVNEYMLTNKELYITKEELMFIGSLIHSKLLLEEEEEMDSKTYLENDEILNTLWDFLTKQWLVSGTRQVIERYDIEEVEISDMSKISLGSIANREHTRQFEVRLQEGPGLLAGYYKVPDKKRVRFKMKNSTTLHKR